MLPKVIFFAGKKRSGKDFIADILVAERGFTKIHIAEPWIRRHLADMDVTWEQYQANKNLYRAEIQRRGSIARAEDPDCLVKELPSYIEPLLASGKRVAVSGIRFTNESNYGIDRGYLVIKVVCPDDVRRQRFIEAGEDLSLFDDPFEREIAEMPYHFPLWGDLRREEYLPIIETRAREFRSLLVAA